MSPHPEPLRRRLWFNCLLAAVIPMAVAALAGVGLQLRHEALVRDLVSAERAQALVLAATLGATPEAIRKADPSWLGVARLRWNGHATEVLAAAGTLALRADETPPDLLLAVNGPQHWRIAGELAAIAVVERDGRGDVAAFWYGESMVPSADRSMLWGFLVSLAVLGLGCGWYLARRIWAPIEDLQRYAEATARGEIATLSLGSEETESLRTSIIALADRAQGRSLVAGGEPAGGSDAPH